MPRSHHRKSPRQKLAPQTAAKLPPPGETVVPVAEEPVPRVPLRLAIWALACFILFETLISICWYRIDHRPPRWDESHFFYMAEYAFDQLSQGHLIGALDLHGVTSTKSGMIPFLTALTFFVWGHSPSVAAFAVNWGSCVLLAAALIAGSQQLFRTVVPGLLSALLFYATQGIMIWAGYYQVDLPLSAFVITTVMLASFAEQQRFRPPIWAMAALGAVITLGICTKHLYVGFTGLSLIWLFIRSLLAARGGWNRLRSRLPLIGVITAATSLGLLYHLLNWHIIAEQLRRSANVAATGAVTAPPSLVSVSHDILVELPARPAFFVGAFLIGAAIMCVRNRPGTVYILLSLAGGWGALWKAASFPLSYYLFPLLPAFLFTASFIVMATDVFKRAPAWAGAASRVVAAAFILAAAAYQVQARLSICSMARVIPAAYQIATSAVLQENPFSCSQYWVHTVVDGNTATLPYPQNWHIDDIMRVLAAIPARSAGPPWNAKLLADLEWMSGELFRYETLAYHLNSVWVSQPAFGAAASPAMLTAGADILIAKSGRIFKEYPPWAAPTEQAANELLANSGALLAQAGFRRIRTFPFPDGSEVSIWMQNSPRQ